MQKKKSMFSQIYPLGPEVIQGWRRLRPVTSQLTEANIKYRWLSLVKFRTLVHDKTFIITDEESGAEYLCALNSDSMKDPTRLQKPK